MRCVFRPFSRSAAQRRRSYGIHSVYLIHTPNPPLPLSSSARLFQFQKTVSEVCTDVQTKAEQTAFRLTKKIDDAKDSLQKICMDENPTTKDNGLEKRRQCFFEKVLQRLTDLAEDDRPRLRQALADFLQPTILDKVAAAVGASTNCDDSDAVYHNLKPKSSPWLTREVPNSNVQLWSQREFYDD